MLTHQIREALFHTRSPFPEVWVLRDLLSTTLCLSASPALLSGSLSGALGGQFLELVGMDFEHLLLALEQHC